MKRIARILVVVAVFATIVALPAAAVSEVGVPFKATFVGVDAYGSPVSCPAGTSWRYFSSGDGQLTHLGRTEVEATHCTVFDPTTNNGTFGNGTITFTAANGDTLVIAQFGTFYIEGDPSPGGGGLSIIEGGWTVVNGDGRFDGATGSGSLSGVSDLDGGTTSVHLVGTILYDASNRSSR